MRYKVDSLNKLVEGLQAPDIPLKIDYEDNIYYIPTSSFAENGAVYIEQIEILVNEYLFNNNFIAEVEVNDVFVEITELRVLK